MRRVAQYRTSIESPPSRLSCRRRCSRNCVRVRSLSLPHGQRADALPLARTHAWHARMARMHARTLARTLARANLTHARARTYAMHARSYKKRTGPRTLHYEARTCGVAPCVARVCAQLAAHVHARARARIPCKIGSARMRGSPCPAPRYPTMTQQPLTLLDLPGPSPVHGLAGDNCSAACLATPIPNFSMEIWNCLQDMPSSAGLVGRPSSAG